MDFDNLKQIKELAAIPPPPPKPMPKWNGWSTPLRGLAAGASEVGGFVADALKGYGQTMAATGTQSAGGMFALQSDAEARESELQRAKIASEGVDTTSGVGTSLRNVSRDYRPDPATAGLAEHLVFDLTRFLTKAVGYTVTGGVVPGATMLAVDEGMQTADDLALQGVDKATRTKVGAVAGGAAAAGVLLPVAAPGSVAKTVGLWALGGPGAFVAQQATTREILKSADYRQLAEQYDPLDPVGLAVASFIPGVFGAHAVIKARGAKGAAPRQDTPASALMPDAGAVAAPEPAKASLTADQADAVMTHNLTLAQDVRDATSPAEATASMRPRPAFEEGKNLTPEQRAVEQRFADQVLSDVDATLAAYEKLPETKGGKVVNTDAFRELSPDYAGSKEGRSKYAAAVHEPSSWLAREQYARLLARPAETGEVMILGGGGGSGKSSSLDVVSPGYAARYDAIYDTTLANSQRAVQAIEDALASGRRVMVNFVARDPFDAIVGGVIPRAERDGRTVPLAVAAKAHEDAPRTLASLFERYADDDRVSIRMIDNTGAPGGQRVLTEMPAFDYNRLVERVHDAADKLYEQRQLSQATYDGLVAGRPSQDVARRPETGSGNPGVRGSPAEVVAGERPSEASPDQSGVTASSGTEAANDAAAAASILSRTSEIERTTPDLVVGIDADGRGITAKQALEQIRREVADGTDVELGTLDAPLINVAANCALSTGSP